MTYRLVDNGKVLKEYNHHWQCVVWAIFHKLAGMGPWGVVFFGSVKLVKVERSEIMADGKRIAQIVDSEDLVALEDFCLCRTYESVLKLAKEQGVDLEALEELLWEIS